MPRANWDFIRKALLPLPPLREQQAIAAFLDRRTAEIDALVESQRRLIERLAEYRTALVTRTVTRGLPPEAARTADLDPHPRLKGLRGGVAREGTRALAGKAAVNGGGEVGCEDRRGMVPRACPMSDSKMSFHGSAACCRLRASPHQRVCRTGSPQVMCCSGNCARTSPKCYPRTSAGCARRSSWY